MVLRLLPFCLLIFNRLICSFRVHGGTTEPDVFVGRMPCRYHGSQPKDSQFNNYWDNGGFNYNDEFDKHSYGSRGFPSEFLFLNPARRFPRMFLHLYLGKINSNDFHLNWANTIWDSLNSRKFYVNCSYNFHVQWI